MPQRFLRPGIRTSDAWNAVSFGAQSLYVRILTLVDDFGRYDARLAILHGECFALRNDVKPQQTAAFRSELIEAGLIDVYSVLGKEYLQVSKWQERSRSEKSKFPDPQDSAAERSVPQEKDASLAIVPAIATTSSSSVLRYPAGSGGDFVLLFEKWISFRKGLGRKPKDWHALFQEQLDWLEKQPEDEWKEILSQSIRNGWQGLFEIKNNGNGQHSPRRHLSFAEIEKRKGAIQAELNDQFKSAQHRAQGRTVVFTEDEKRHRDELRSEMENL